MLLSELLIKSGEFSINLSKVPEIEITDIESDSRKIEPGDLFVALEGGSTDGHTYINAAISNGAAAVVGQKHIGELKCPYFQVKNPRQTLAFLAAALNGNPARKLTMIGVTGTDGKTTTVNLIYNILISCGIKAGMISTVNAVIGNETIDTGFHVTTPDATTIQYLLRKMVDQGITHVVLETTSHGLDQFRVDACEFDIAVATNITHEHLDYHGNYEGYFKAKFKLLEELVITSKKSFGNPRLAVFNRDDISFLKIRERLKNPGYATITAVDYGISDDAEICAQNINFQTDGLKFDVKIYGQIQRVVSPLVGSFNVHNILAAISATVLGLKLDLACVLDGIKSMPDVPGRMERINLGQEFLAIVDFAHTPNALKEALQTARQLTSGQVIVVFGSAGLRDREKRRLMAAESLRHADITILTAEDPRTESLSSILTEMAGEAVRNGGKTGKNYFIVEDRGEAIRKAVSLAKKGDVVMACGKGHEQSMCFGDTEYLWDDRAAMRAALAEKLGIQGPLMPWLPTQEKKNR
ncbi:MAG: UDP-N-acetylmuramoyl-L-alanyl-D-glutamate--2,6-diaminopimelate ligase [Pelolinea sp.]|nr:UDP-N-acetylmuramoyl-L-alanyl-D-glutamate--2,6-diaminopimelate ligase [Pelolinea sp.]